MLKIPSIANFCSTVVLFGTFYNAKWEDEYNPKSCSRRTLNINLYKYALRHYDPKLYIDLWDIFKRVIK